MVAHDSKSRLLSFLPPGLRRLWALIKTSPIGYRLARGAFWSLMGALISRGIGLVASVFVARMLGKVGFGELGMIQSTLGMFGLIAGFGMGVTATKYVAELRDKDPKRTARIIALSSMVAWSTGLLLTAVLVIIAPWLARRMLAAPQLGESLRIGSLLLLLGAVNGAQTGALSGFEAFKRIAQIAFIAGLSTFPLMVAGVWLLGLKGAVGALVFSQTVSVFFSFVALRKEAAARGLTLGYTGLLSELPVLWCFSLPAVLGGLITTVVYWLSGVMLVNRTDGYGEMGTFNAANQWFNALLFLPGVLSQAVLPMLAESKGNGDNVQSARVLSLSIKLSGFVILPLVVVGCIASPHIMASYGANFKEAWPTLIVILLTTPLLAVLTPVGQVLAAAGRMWVDGLMNLGWGLIFLGFTAILLSWGALGLASARLIAYLIHAIWMFAFARYLVRKGAKSSSIAVQPVQDP